MHKQTIQSLEVISLMVDAFSTEASRLDRFGEPVKAEALRVVKADFQEILDTKRLVQRSATRCQLQLILLD